MKLIQLSTTAATAVFGPEAVVALFDCNANQNVFPSTPGQFVVHYTSIRDSNFNGDPWIRICKPSANGGFDNVEPLQAGCVGHPVTISAADAALPHDITVTNGNGCESVLGTGNLDNAALDYNGQHRDLGGGDPNCGPRDHGISCEFTI